MKKTKYLPAATLGLLLVASILGNLVFYHRYKKAQNDNPNIQTQRIVDELRKTISLPNETPSVLTVVDKSKLADSEIAKDAQNGDKILLFQKAGQVVVYRPSSHKLINMLSLNHSSKQQDGTKAQAPASQLEDKTAQDNQTQ
jgi:hypothetical protein